MAKLAIIPARGGSKRLPRKNILPFLGKPILAYTIEAAAEAGIFDAVVVSTEDAEIAELARRYGAEVDLRPQSLAEDQATVADVCVELLARKPLPWGDVQQMCVLYATAPLRNANDIREVMALLEPRCATLGLPPLNIPIIRIRHCGMGMVANLARCGRICVIDPAPRLVR